MTDSRYSDLVAALDVQYAKTARFIKAAFHVHSIDSHDWGKDADPARNAQSQFEGPVGQDHFLDELIGAGLDIACITDHMKTTYACELAKRAATRGDITVLPGMEISCLVPPGHKECIHVLAIFPPDTTPDVIDRLFVDTNLPGASERDGHEQATFSSLKVVRDRVADAGGLFVLAHIDQQPRGHRSYVRSIRGETAKMFGQDPSGSPVVTDISNEYAEHLAELAPHAVEVMKSEDRQHYWGFTTADGTKHDFPGLARSDHHAVESFANDDTVTYIKVSKSDIDCIKRALVFHDTRIRFSNDLPPSPSPRLVGVRIRGSGDGLFREATIAFNENLNCLIGPRGSGKSTVIEALRYVLGQRGLLVDADASGGESNYAGLALATLKANLKDSEIELIYERDGKRHLLTATYDPNSASPPHVFTPDGTDCHVPPSALLSSFPARIFSWGELETLGRRPRLQRMVLDRLVEALPPLQQQKEDLRRKLEASRRRITELRHRMAGLLAADGRALGRYTEWKTAYERLNTPEVATLFADLDRTRAEIQVITTADEELDQLAVAIDSLRNHKIQDGIDDVLNKGSDELKAWWAAHVAPILELDGLSLLLESQVGALLAEISKRREKLVATRAMKQEEANKAEDALREQTHADPGTSVRREQREQARRQYSRSIELRNEYLATFENMTKALEERAALLSDLIDVRSEISGARKDAAETLVGQLADIGYENQKITIDVTDAGDRTEFEAYLDTFLNVERGGQYRAKGLATRLAHVPPAELAKAITDGDTSAIIDDDLGISQDDADRLVNAFNLYEHDEGADVKRVTEHLEELLMLEEQPADDLVSIRSNGQPVDELSPGGRSSAMLPLIALSDKVPLIIDQPEDNLDNRMVGRTLSTILERLKEHRQIIVTTHNPNIVVGGDAEQVVVLDAPTARSAKIELTGSIDDDDVIDAVIKIMEGGREAFEERQRRYRDRLKA